MLKQSLLKAQNSHPDNWNDKNFTEFESIDSIHWGIAIFQNQGFRKYLQYL